MISMVEQVKAEQMTLRLVEVETQGETGRARERGCVYG